MDNIAEQIITKPKRGNPAWKKGVSGNPQGQPRKPEIEILRRALDKAKEEKGIDFIEHFVNMSYTHKECAIALMKKLIPDKLQGEGFGANVTNAFFGEGINPDRRRELIEWLREKRSTREPIKSD